MIDDVLKILVSNDDGVYASGIHTLAEALSEVADVQVVAPDRNRSGASHSLTLSRPLRVKKIHNGFMSVEGTPSDCVHLAVYGLLDPQPDMVVSGINDGANLGDDVLYSGTVAAAVEGRHLGLPAMAVSLVGPDSIHYDAAAKVTAKLVVHMLANPLPKQTILNVNVPNLPYDQIQGTEVTRLGTRQCAKPVIKGTDPRGNVHYWIGTQGPEADCGPGTDFFAIKRGFVSVTPLNLDMTHYQSFDSLTHWVNLTD